MRPGPHPRIYNTQTEFEMVTTTGDQNHRQRFNFADAPEMDNEEASRPNSLGQLVAIAAVTGSAIAPIAQGCLGDKNVTQALLISAAVTEAGFLYSAGKFNALALAGYLYQVLIVVEALELMNGFGAPNTGNEFSDGRTTFSHDIFDILHSAAAIDWSGESALEYNSQNAKQQVNVRKMAATDGKIARILATQADQVERARQGLAGSRLAVFGGIAITTAVIKIILEVGSSAAAAALFAALTAFVEYVAYAVATVALGLLITLLVGIYCRCSG